MIPSLNFNPSFANLAALHGLGGMPHPIRPGGAPLSTPMTYTPPAMPIGGMPAPQPQPIYSGMPMQSAMQQYPQGNLSNLHALMQLLGPR